MTKYVWIVGLIYDYEGLAEDSMKAFSSEAELNAYMEHKVTCDNGPVWVIYKLELDNPVAKMTWIRWEGIDGG